MRPAKGAALAQRCIMCHQLNGNGPAFRLLGERAAAVGHQRAGLLAGSGLALQAVDLLPDAQALLGKR